MQKINLTSFWTLCLLVFLVSCASQPVDTLNKRLSVFEITYIETLKKIKLWIDEGNLSTDQVVSIKKSVNDMADARQALYLAKSVGDIATVEGQLKIANVSMQLLRDYIANKKEVVP